jgi:hypothetical protein
MWKATGQLWFCILLIAENVVDMVVMKGVRIPPWSRIILAKLHLLAGHKTRRPVQPLATMMGAQKSIGTELKKMAPILEPKFPHDGLQAIQILQSYAGSPFLAVRKTTCGVGFHSIESKSRRSKTAHFRGV